MCRRKPPETATPLTRMSSWLGVLVPTGVEERGIGAQGLPRNLGDLVVSAKAVLPSEGKTEAKQEERRGVLAGNSTDEAGIADLATPLEGRT